ncbi:MAG: potassium-transporting ATPase subunit C, partial [Oscillospiraceae bacterium]
ALTERVQGDMDAFLAAHPGLTAAELPGDLFTASGSGLDPDISPAAATVQLPGLAASTGLSEKVLAEMVADNTTGKFLGIFGEDRVNVLGVNLAIARALDFI